VDSFSDCKILSEWKLDGILIYTANIIVLFSCEQEPKHFWLVGLNTRPGNYPTTYAFIYLSIIHTDNCIQILAKQIEVSCMYVTLIQNTNSDGHHGSAAAPIAVGGHNSDSVYHIVG